MKYPHWKEYDNAKKWRAIADELKLETNNATTKQDLTNMVKFLASEAARLQARVYEHEEARMLTVEELKQMDGKPVYLQFGDGEQGWAIFSYGGDDTSFGAYGIDFPNEYPDIDFYNMEYSDPAGHYGLHVLGWRAYKNEPSME